MDYYREKEEAIRAGERALLSLREAKQQIGVARGFGIWDLLGGRTFVSIAKHFKIDRARDSLNRAKYDLQVFARELQDIQMNLNIDIGGFLTVFDLMDSFLADVIVQSRLAGAADKIDNAIRQVENCLYQLK